MKHFLVILLMSMTVHLSYGQCAPCTAGPAACPIAGGLCNKSDTGMANQPYQSTIRFYLPTILRDPTLLAQCSGCSYIKLRNVKITGLTNLPSGITNYNFDKVLAPYKGYYDVEAGDTLGCVSICGTPIAAGVYVISVNLLADVTAVGTPIGNVDQNNNSLTYTDTMYILPDTSGSVASFTFGGIRESCDSVKACFDATFVAPSPNITRYNWNFGNGTTSTIKNPGCVTYKQPGTYDVTLQTVFYDYYIKKFHINNMTNSGSWRGDIEELLSGDPDTYTIIGALGVNTRANPVDASTNFDLAIPAAQSVLPAGTTSLSFELWDKDNGPPVGSQDDFLGTYNININSFPFLPYDVNFSGSNSQGYITIDTVRSTVITDTLKIVIKAKPVKPLIEASVDTICFGDSIRLVATPYCATCTYSWTRDDTVSVFGMTDSAFYTTFSGRYKANVIDNFTGCTNTGDSSKAVYFAEKPDDYYAVAYYSPTNVVFVNPSLGTTFKARWFKDGLEITGQTGKQIPFLGDGLYEVQVYNPIFEGCSSMSDTVRISTVGIANELANSYNLNLYPNPTKGSVHLSLQIDVEKIEIQVLDMTGRVVYISSESISLQRLEKDINLDFVNKGVYTVLISANGNKISKKLVVQ
jgi:PKD repeat protein